MRAIAMFGVLLASYAINAMDRQLFPLLAPEVRREYGFSLAGIGFLSTVFTFGMAVAGVPTGYLLARFSRRTVAQLGIALFSAGTAVTVLSTGFSDMLMYRAVTGVGEAMQLTVLLAIAANYFVENRSVAVGAINFFFAVGAIIGPLLGGVLLRISGTWRVPMVVYGLLGFVAIAAIGLAVRLAFTETVRAASIQPHLPYPPHAAHPPAGAGTLLNRNTIILTVMSVIGGLVIYGYLGMYPTFLREALKYSPADTGKVMSIFGLGALASLGGGWLGDRVSPRLLLSATFFCAAGLGYLLFHGSPAFAAQATFSFLWGIVVSGVVYVNLAGAHVKALSSSLASRASGLFVTSLYGAGAAAGYLMGWITQRGGWVTAGEVQISLLSLAAAGLALMLRPDRMAR